jgi:hypothetical protein
MKYILALCLALFAVSTVAPQQATAQEAERMNFAELTSSAATLIQGMQAALTEVEQLLGASVRDATDAQRTEYLTEVVRQVGGFVAVSVEAKTSLDASQSDPEFAATQYNLIYRSSVRVNQLLAQARGYNGADARYSDSTVRNPVIDESIPRVVTWLEDTQEFFFDPTIGTTLGAGTEGVTP